MTYQDECPAINDLTALLIEHGTGADAPLQNRPGFQFDRRRDERQIVVRHLRPPPRPFRRVAEIAVVQHVFRICRRWLHVQTCRSLPVGETSPSLHACPNGS